MEKRRITKAFNIMGMRILVNDLVIITEKEFMVIYSQSNDGVNVPICISLKLDNYSTKEINELKDKIITNSSVDNWI